ncbi:glycosyltransferase family 4 protein [Spirosoma sp. RP8]|uniref:Glycosyltransferase family 4 protein n=1 Tax=Spirosoma liriopis TaxID=2937440 RepID=A0ABT0HQ38_9BACT|nr:glycosyltransferase family 4 protein [Spirosoma liriopis]MCK8494279.1 glycosyltransferase family 4 protein [Spirosoma liriopis]
MKIVVASKGDPNDIKTWSGIPYYIYKALEKKGHRVYGVNLLAPSEPWYYTLYKRIYYKLYKKWLWVEMEPYYLKKIAEQFDREVNAINPDLVILIHGHFLAYTTFKQNTVVVHDTTFAQIIDYYADFTVLTPRSIKNGNAVYQRGLDRATAAVFSSDWASQSALSHYRVDPSKIHTIPFGANLSQIPHTDHVEQWINNRLDANTCNFLFLGIDWERKGGPDALRFVIELNRLGIRSCLVIVGCQPDIPETSRQYVKLLGFLRKNVDDEAQKLEALFVSATALLLPSLAECFGCVYCEANAYGLPALGRDTGGVSEAIKEGVNGLLMKTDEAPEAFAQRWARIWYNKKVYSRLAESARREFDERLNYDVFINKLVYIVGEEQGEPALPA